MTETEFVLNLEFRIRSPSLNSRGCLQLAIDARELIGVADNADSADPIIFDGEYEDRFQPFAQAEHQRRFEIHILNSERHLLRQACCLRRSIQANEEMEHFISTGKRTTRG